MTKLRILIFLLTIIIVGVAGYFVSLYARGYRFDRKTLKFTPNGLLVVKSDPDGAQVFINGDLRTATNATISLSPGTYDVAIKKDGYFAWSKRLSIQKEVVTQTQASLFRVVPSFSPITFSGAINPVSSSDSTKIAYLVPRTSDNEDKAGLWVLDTFNLPLGFPRDPRRITDGDLTDSTYIFAPSGRELLLISQNGVFLLDTGTFTPQNQRVNVIGRKDAILASWEGERKTKLSAQIKTLPGELADILGRKAETVTFSPDETMILYTASVGAELSENLASPLPGSSTQKQERTIKEHNTYVYDIKEDRNFLITDQENPALRWFPTSRNLILAEDGRITIMDYDGTNRQTVYSGSYIAPDAYPYANISNLLILTNLGASSSLPNLYSLSLK